MPNYPIWPRLCHVAGPGQAGCRQLSAAQGSRARAIHPSTACRRPRLCHVAGPPGPLCHVTGDASTRPQVHVAHLDLKAHGSIYKVANGPRHTPFRAFCVCYLIAASLGLVLCHLCRPGRAAGPKLWQGSWVLGKITCNVATYLIGAALGLVPPWPRRRAKGLGGVVRKIVPRLRAASCSVELAGGGSKSVRTW